jgi:polyisoprenoid-binding protein YceI
MRHARPLRRGGTAPPRDRRHGVTARATTPTSQHLALAIRTASIDTRNAKRDAHLRNNAFFDVDTYPEILFVSTAVEQTSAARYRVTGDLTIKDVTKPVTVDLEYTGAAADPSGDHRIGFEGNATLNRMDWGVSWNAPLEGRGMLISRKVTVEFEVSAIPVAHVNSERCQ